MKNIESEILKQKIKIGLKAAGAVAFGSLAVFVGYETIDSLITANGIVSLNEADYLNPNKISYLNTINANAVSLTITIALLVSIRDSYRKIKDLRQYQKIRKYS